MPLLSELYSIHFDDRAAHINRGPVSYKNCKLLLEIICHLMEIYGYKGMKVNFSENVIKEKEVVELNNDCPESTLPWLTILIREIAQLWEYMKQETAKRKEKMPNYTLPFPIVLEPEISIGKIPLKAGPGYDQVLKCLTHDLKFLVSFEFSQRK